MIIGSGGSTSGLSGTIGIGSRLHGTSITGGPLGSNTAGGTSTEMLSNYKSHPGSVLAGGGGGGITTDFDSVSQLSQKAYTNTMAQIPRTSGGIGGGSGGNMTIGDLANLETSDTSVIDYNLVNEEMKYRANLDNMYKKGILLYICCTALLLISIIMGINVNIIFQIFLITYVTSRSIYNDNSYWGVFHSWR